MGTTVAEAEAWAVAVAESVEKKMCEIFDIQLLKIRNDASSRCVHRPCKRSYGYSYQVAASLCSCMRVCIVADVHMHVHTYVHM